MSNVTYQVDVGSEYQTAFNALFNKEGIVRLSYNLDRNGYSHTLNEKRFVDSLRESFPDMRTKAGEIERTASFKISEKVHPIIELCDGIDLHHSYDGDWIFVVADSTKFSLESLDAYVDAKIRLAIKRAVRRKRDEPFKKRAFIQLIVPTMGGLTTTSQELKLKDNVVDNYMPETVEFYNKCKSVLENESKGMLLLYGPPGTGKTTLIRQLAYDIDRRFLFIPASMIDSLASPKLIPLLLDNKNCVLVIEDAETALRERDKAFSQASASTLLQLSDGILSDVLGVTIIATFNTSLDNIDPAFVRAGRCLAKHEFPLLSGEKLQAIAAKNQLQVEASQAMSIAQIMNQ